MSVTINIQYSKPFFPGNVYGQMLKKVVDAHSTLLCKEGQGAEYTGWVGLPDKITDMEINDILKAAEEIRQSSQVLVVVGIGGSYLGARAALEFLDPALGNRPDSGKIEVIYAGNNLSTDYLGKIISYLKDKDFSVNVISKSGTTTESAVSFRILNDLLIQKYGEKESNNRIFVTTDPKSGPLVKYAEKKGYRRFVIPPSVGGRYSILSAVGLLPMAVAGVDIKAVMRGAKTACRDLKAENPEENPAMIYAAARNTLYACEKTTEILCSFEPNLTYFAEWWKQLYGESEGKEYKGLFPASVSFTADLHSLGQYIQEGKRDLFETVIEIENPQNEILIPHQQDDFDGLNYLEGQSLAHVNLQAMRAVTIAHMDGGVPIIGLSIKKADEYHFGYLVYFFELACGISGYVLGVNPFNQPGVEDYKKNMFALLGKSGFEARSEELRARLKKSANK